jgi:hypothetical protein
VHWGGGDAKGNPDRHVPRRAVAAECCPDAGGAMTRGQIEQIADLNKCHLLRIDKVWLRFITFDWEGGTAVDRSYEFDKEDKAILRRLTHQYRNQIAAVKKNNKPMTGAEFLRKIKQVIKHSQKRANA